MPQNKFRTKNNHKSSPLPKILILAGIVILVTTIFLLKKEPTRTANPSEISAEAQFDRYLEEGKPIFLFFHSNNCDSCIEMIAVVEQVYPEFDQVVELVDVNVYDPANQNLLRRANITVIPTQMFLEAGGQGQVAIGVMSPESLRQQLQALAKDGR